MSGRSTYHPVGRWATPACVGAASLVAFVWLAAETAEGDRFALDGHLLDAVARVENTIFEGAMVLFAFFGAGAGLLVLLSALVAGLLRRGRRSDALFVVLSLVMAQVVGRLVKAAIDEPRPGRTDHELVHGLTDLRHVGLAVLAGVVLIACTTPRWRRGALAFAATYAALFVAFELLLRALIGPQEAVAFPSGHATSSMTVVATGIVLAWPSPRRWAWLALGVAFAFGVGLSRVAFGVHRPSDVLGGWLLATAIVSVAATCYFRVPSLYRALRAWMPPRS
jgi:membrane-associated phospholipid phosphatase